MKNKTLVACRIFEDELNACLKDRKDVRIVWVDAALHADLDLLEKELRNVLAQTDPQKESVRLLFGSGCHPEMAGIAKELGTQTAPCKNCIEWLAGEETKELEQNHTMLMTPAWVRVWPKIMSLLGWSEVDVRMQLGRYDRILVLDPGLNPLTDEETLEFFDLVQVPVEPRPVDLEHFCSRLDALLN